MRHGTGICKFSCGAIYKGEWKDGNPHGHGILFCAPNEMLECNFDNWRIIDGQVKILFGNGEFYEGGFKNNCRNAMGTHHYACGDVYEGEWLVDKRVNRGRILISDGSRLTG